MTRHEFVAETTVRIFLQSLIFRNKLVRLLDPTKQWRMLDFDACAYWAVLLANRLEAHREAPWQLHPTVTDAK